MKVLRMADLDLRHKRILVREDFNVPIANGAISSAARLTAALPTVRLGLDKGAAILLVSHLGRPQAGHFSAEHSLAPVAQWLSHALGRRIPLLSNWIDGVSLKPGDIALGENCRFLVGEKEDDANLARRMAALCDVYVMDAFATAHRAEASTHGVAEFAPVACAGPLLVAELEALQRALANPQRPLVAVVGGNKVKTKLGLMARLGEMADQLFVGGAIANTFLAAAGYEVGRSIYEPQMLESARAAQRAILARGGRLVLPADVVVASEPAAGAQAAVRNVGEVGAGDMILDVGPRTREHLAREVNHAGTVLWNGPLGMFEQDAFAAGTRALADAIAGSGAFSLAGGGETIAAIERFGIAGRVGHVSTGGGAFLEYIEGRTLPAVEILESRCRAAT